MIAEAAYYRALRRGFNGGDPVDDWLDAEQEIDRALMIPAWQKRESAAHEASERHAPPMRPQSSHQRRQFRDSK